jgi:WD40 repeat protein
MLICSTFSCLHVYDFNSNKHKATVRDVSWHPYLPAIATASWDGSCRLYDYQRPAKAAATTTAAGAAAAAGQFSFVVVAGPPSDSDSD